MLLKIEHHHFHHADPAVMRTLERIEQLIMTTKADLIQQLAGVETAIQNHIADASDRVTTDIAGLRQQIVDLSGKVGETLTQADIDPLLAQANKAVDSADAIDPRTPPTPPPTPAPEPAPTPAPEPSPEPAPVVPPVDPNAPVV